MNHNHTDLHRISSHHGGSPRLATFFLTNQCTRQCQYCYAIENTFLIEDDWNFPAIRAFLDVLARKGFRVAIGGGEPLTKTSLMLEMAREISTRRMGTCLLTNGDLLDEILLRKLYNSGVNWIQISADSAQEVERFAPLLAKGTAMGIQMAIGTVLMPQFIQEIPIMHRLLEESHATAWRILRYTALNNHQQFAQAPTNQEWIAMLLTVEEFLRSQKSSIQIRYEPSVVPLTWLMDQSDENKLDICGGRRARRIFVYPTGEVFACGLPRRKGIFLGNFMIDLKSLKINLDKISEKYVQFSGSGFPENPYCREICRGGCLQMKNDHLCDPRCELQRNLVPVCCFEKLLLASGNRSMGKVIYPSELFENILRMSEI